MTKAAPSWFWRLRPFARAAIWAVTMGAVIASLAPLELLTNPRPNEKIYGAPRSPSDPLPWDGAAFFFFFFWPFWSLICLIPGTLAEYVRQLIAARPVPGSRATVALSGVVFLASGLLAGYLAFTLLNDVPFLFGNVYADLPDPARPGRLKGHIVTAPDVFLKSVALILTLLVTRAAWRWLGENRSAGRAHRCRALGDPGTSRWAAYEPTPLSPRAGRGGRG